MFETILIILIVLWALGLFTFHAGGLIHILIVIALIVLIIRLLQGRRVLELDDGVFAAVRSQVI